MPEIELIEESDRFFIKSFIIDESLNLNYWATTDAAIDEYLTTFIDKPFVLTPDRGHPDARDGKDLMIQQEKFRAGTILSVGRDASNGKAWAISEITDEEAKQALKSGEVRFVSPSITFNTDTDMISVAGNDIVTKFNAAHLAGVKEPAYGMQKAQIKGQCSGSPGTCLPQLSNVQASIEKSKCGKYITIHDGKTVRMIKNASECIEKCLKSRAEQNDNIDDEAIARCYNECEFDPNNGDTPSGEKIDININVNEAQETPNQVCTKCEKDDCTCAKKGAYKGKNEGNTMTEDTDKKEEKKSNEEELEDERKEEARKAEEEDEKEDAKKADEDKDAPLDAEEDEKEKEKDARIRALESELSAEKKSFINQILAAKKAGGHIFEAEEKSEAKKLKAETLVTLKELAAQYTERAEASTPKGKPYHVLEFNKANIDNSKDGFLKMLGAKSD